jgi:hypothetical protein
MWLPSLIGAGLACIGIFWIDAGSEPSGKAPSCGRDVFITKGDLSGRPNQESNVVFNKSIDSRRNITVIDADNYIMSRYIFLSFICRWPPIWQADSSVHVGSNRWDSGAVETKVIDGVSGRSLCTTDRTVLNLMDVI